MRLVALPPARDARPADGAPGLSTTAGAGRGQEAVGGAPGRTTARPGHYRRPGGARGRQVSAGPARGEQQVLPLHVTGVGTEPSAEFGKIPSSAATFSGSSAMYRYAAMVGP